MEKPKYKGKMEWKFKNINVDVARKELERIEEVYGKITPFYVLEAAIPKESVLHSCFEWNDEKAAHQHRLSQARTLIANIEVSVISDGKERKIRAYEVVHKPEGNQYKSITTLSIDEVDVVRLKAIKEINYWKNKLSAYKEFESIVEEIEILVIKLEESKFKEAVA